MPITPGLNLPFGIQPVNPVPVDANYGPYVNIAEAVAAIPLALRYDGLTVQITGSGNYWWLAADLSDLGLVAKGGGASGLPAVLTLDNTTGANNISINTTQSIVSGNGGGQLDLDYGGTSSKVILSNDSGTESGSWLKLESGVGTQAGLFWNDGVNVPSLITIDDTDGIMIRMNDAFIQIDHGGGPLGPSIYMEGDWLTINVSGHLMNSDEATWNISADYALTAGNSVSLTAQGSDLSLTATGLGANIVLTPANSVIINTALQYVDGNEAAGYVLTSDATGNATWQTAPTAVSYIMSPDDKFHNSVETFVDGDVVSLSAITNTPVNGCYVAVYINGIEYEVGNGDNSKACYFGDGASPNLPRGFSASHPNGQVQSGDLLYWNGSVVGFELKAGWRVAFHYLI